MGQVTRHGAVMVIQSGDTAISGALASGALAAIEARRGERPLSTAPRGAATFPIGGRLGEAERQAVEAEIDRQAIRRDMEGDAVQRALLRVAVNNTKTAEDYAAMTSRAEIEWGEPVDYPTPLERFADAVLALYAMVICGLSAAYHAQDKMLEG